MTETRTLHSVRVRNDLWKAFLIWQTNEYHNSFQDFVEECLIEKLGLKENINEEIQKRNLEITRLQDLNRLSEDFLKSSRKTVDVLEETRKKGLSGLIKTDWKEWTSLYKKHAIEVGNFKDREELEKWVKEHQG